MHFLPTIAPFRMSFPTPRKASWLKMQYPGNTGKQYQPMDWSLGLAPLNFMISVRSLIHVSKNAKIIALSKKIMTMIK